MISDHCNQHPQSSDIAYHFEWGFKKEVFLWYGKTPLYINFLPIATELKNWMLRKGQFSVIVASDSKPIERLTNPYSYNASAIAAMLIQSITANHNFASSVEEMDEMDAEIERIRLYNEQVLYTARVCEVTIKQLLFCTLIPAGFYKNAALGGLLSSDCKACRKAKKPHKISLLGSLAHRYQLCLPFENCLFEHLKIVNRRRNVEAAHSEIQAINIRGWQKSRDQLMKDSFENAKELLHMLEHISDLEQEMIRNLGDLRKIPYEEWN